MSSAARSVLCVLCLAALPVGPIGSTRAAAPETAREDPRQILIDRQERHRTQADEHLTELTVIARNGNVRRRQWRSYRQGWGATSSRLIRFLSPPDVRGVGYLLRQRPSRPPDEWLYLPSMKRERRIVASDRDAAFVGTDFTFEDLEEFDEANYDLALLPDRTVEDRPSFAIEAVPRTRSAYARKILVIRKEDLCLLGVEYQRTGERGVSKRLTLSDYQNVEGHQIAMRIEMADLVKGSRTILAMRSVTLNRPQPSDRYTIENLLREDVDAGQPLGEMAPDAVGVAAAWSAARVRWSAAGSPPAAARPRLSQAFSGHVENRTFLQLDAARRGTVGTAWGEAFMRYSARAGPFRFRAAVRAEQSSSPAVGALAFDPADRKRRRSPLSVRELSFLVPIFPGIDLQAGQWSVSWAQTDGYSPADAFLPRDFSDPLTEERLPIWGSRLHGERAGVRFDVLVAVTTTPWRLPPMEGPNSPLASVNIFLVEQPSPVPQRGFQAVKVGGTIGRWDVAVWTRTGVRPCPILEPLTELLSTTEAGRFLPVRRRFADETAAGIQIARDYRGWLLHGEIGAARSDDRDVGTSVIWTFGGQRVVRDGALIGTMAVNAVTPPSEPLLLFDRALLPMVVLSLHQNESWGRWTAGWLATFDRVGGALMMEAVKNLTAVVKLAAGVDLPHGVLLSPARAFSGGKRVRTSLRWEW